MEQVIVITGPTCSGKTRLSLNIAGILNTEIISADSRQIYKLLDTGTAKPSAADLKQIKHHFVDYLYPGENFNVSDFENKALKIIHEIHSANKIPVVTGGSGLYIKALIDGIFNSVDTDEEYRIELLNKKKELGNQFLYDELKKIDPVSASKMLPQNYKRVIRALEVYHLTGRPISELQKEYTRNVNLKFYQYGLKWERKILYDNIEKRVDDMIKAGLVEEVKGILEKGYDKNINALNTVGYKEIISYLDGGINLDRAIELIKRNTRWFAKRQMTWFNKDKRIKWISIHDIEELHLAADQIIIEIRKNSRVF
jgi:tRNA dimethylallyltransferase